MTSRVAAIIPVIDEVSSIASLVAGLRANGSCCVIVVDGGSRDGTQEVAHRSGAIVIEEPRRGYGRACLTGAAAAMTSTDGHIHDAVAFLDGDGSCDPADLPRLLAALDTAHVALGHRPGHRLEPGAMPWHARLGNALVAAIVSLRTGRRVRDLPPFKAIRSASLQRLALTDERYGWTVQFVARALLDRDLRVREVPVAFRRRQGGRSKVSGSWRASVGAGRAMMTTAFRESRQGRPVVLMAKAPRAGHAKTRLAAELGEALTAELWAACIADVGRTVDAVSVAAGRRPIVMAAESSDVDPLTLLLGDRWIPLVQRRPGLGAALTESFLHAFDQGDDGCVAVAADSPTLAPERIAEAFHALAARPAAAVLGPTPDGGYYLVGLRWRAARPWWPAWLRRRARARLERRLSRAFETPSMGSGSALDGTRQGMHEGGWRVVTIDPWSDLDTLADLRALAVTLAGDGHRPPATTEWIGRHQAVIEDRVNEASAVHQERA